MIPILHFAADRKPTFRYSRPSSGLGQAGLRPSGNPGSKIVLFAWMLFVSFPYASHAAELGRLFFTPQERADLEARGGMQNDERDRRDSITINGMIQKSDGKRIIWLDGKPQTQPVSPGQSPTRVQVVLPGAKTPVEVKVGQRIELNPVQTAPQE